MSPPRDVRTTDASRLSFPLPLTLTMLGLAIAAAAGVWRIESQVSVITTSISYERQLDTERAKYLDQRFESLEAKIESAGLRNAAMTMAQELQKAQAAKGK